MDPAAPAPPRRSADGGATPSPWGVERERRLMRRRHRQAGALLALYVGLVALVTLTPDSVDRGIYPLLMRGVRFVQFHGVPAFRYSMIEEGANVALFVPLGMLGVLAFGMRRWWAVALAGTALSACVELAQGAFLPARVASLSDVAENGAGAVIGAALAAAIAVRTRRRRRPRS
ncbi:VanZ family protein [Clavibacter sp. CT19]|uniref:VanZ family protein n=2 Tax=Clavibacter TaxID=1573 RepID=UPI0022EB153A|nr:VanZ family protein [Clavibacter sp. CT19]MDA3803221.1 VanZ family protein [Clavibacter sp. CT19]